MTKGPEIEARTAGTTAVRDVPLITVVTRVVALLAVLQTTCEAPQKFLPVRLRVKSGLPIAADTGDRAVIAGAEATAGNAASRVAVLLPVITAKSGLPSPV